MASPPSVIPRAGEIAFAISVSTLYDLTVGQVNWPVWLRKTNMVDPMDPPLTLTNSVDGGACLDILNWDNTKLITRFTNQGLYQTQIGGYLDFIYQAPPPDAPELPDEADRIRMYAAIDPDHPELGPQLWFKIPGGPPQLIPTSTPTAPQARYAYWIGGG